MRCTNAMKWNERSEMYGTTCLSLHSSSSLSLVTCAWGILLTLYTTLGPQKALMTQLILLSELIYTVEASDDPNLMACPFCPAVRWKTHCNIFTIRSSLITLQPRKGAFCLSTSAKLSTSWLWHRCLCIQCVHFCVCLVYVLLSKSPRAF